MYVFIENEAISSWAVSKRSTYTELEMDVSRNVHFQLYHTLPSLDNMRTIRRMAERENVVLDQQKFGKRMMLKKNWISMFCGEWSVYA